MKGEVLVDNEIKFCPVSVAQNILMGKWKLSILWTLKDKTRRFNELQKLITTISRGVLTQQLRELERDKIINRKVYREVPPKVEYSLTEIGKSFIPIMIQIIEWGAEYIEKVNNCNMDICILNKFPCQRCHEMMQANNTK